MTSADSRINVRATIVASIPRGAAITLRDKGHIGPSSEHPHDFIIYSSAAIEKVEQAIARALAEIAEEGT